MAVVRTRVAPTPSGYLHEGNCVNALLASWWAGETGQVVLRIDDADSTRYRREYAADIFDTLAWLDIHIDLGPRSVIELEDQWSQNHRKSRYREVLQPILDGPLVYTCLCTRTTVQCSCADHKRTWTPGHTLRLRTTDGHQGPVLWRRDDIPAYHLTSVVDDHDFGISHVMRGEDLRESSVLQSNLAELFRLSFPDEVRHHPLLMNLGGHKLSKSTGAMGPLEKTDEVRERIVQTAMGMAPSVGVRPPR